MNKQRFILIFLSGLLMILILGACGTIRTKDTKRTEVLDNFRATLRFSEFNGLAGFIASEYLEKNPITRLETNRLKQVRVSSYTILSVVASDDSNEVIQTVELGMVHQLTASERRVRYIEVWRWDSELSNWRLHSGLPDVDRF